MKRSQLVRLALVMIVGLSGCQSTPVASPRSDAEEYDSAAQVLAMPSRRATVMEIRYCYAVFKTEGGRTFDIGSPKAAPEVVRFLQTLEKGKTYLLPRAFMEYRRKQTSRQATGGTAAANATTNSVHASLVAYPNAVILTNDATTGITVSVEPSGRAVKAVAKDGTVFWNIDVIAAWGKPSVGDAVIRHVTISGEKVQVTIGKHMYGEIELKTGKAVFIGED